ncbi:MAG: hypothetical protein JXR42_03985 [Gammaproteobacteria bacterium]|nr:hypothetical protein [Gammaproteobacteria bacterium]
MILKDSFGFRKIKFVILVLGFIVPFVAATTSFAKDVTVKDFKSDAIKHLGWTGSYVYNRALSVWSNMLYKLAPGIPVMMSRVNNNSKVVHEFSENLKSDSLSYTENFLSGLDKIKEVQNKLADKPAWDDYVENLTSTGGSNSFGNIYQSASDYAVLKAKNAEAMKGNGGFDLESLLGVDVYATDDELNNATDFKNEILYSMAVPAILKINTRTCIPVSQDDGSTECVYTKTLSAGDISNLRSELDKKPEYRQYKKNYRALVAMRNIYANPILHSYNKRVKSSSGKSLLQLQDDAINYRLSKKNSQYWAEIAKAPPVVLQREQLILLAQISKQLQVIEKQNEKLLIMTAVKGLQGMQSAVREFNGQSSVIAGEVAELTHTNISSKS